jgi:hypothetical protein
MSGVSSVAIPREQCGIAKSTGFDEVYHKENSREQETQRTDGNKRIAQEGVVTTNKTSNKQKEKTNMKQKQKPYSIHQSRTSHQSIYRKSLSIN